MKTELNKKNNQTTVVIDVSYVVENKIARDFVKDEHATVFYNLKDDGILRFEWYLNEDDKSNFDENPYLKFHMKSLYHLLKYYYYLSTD